MLPLVLVVGYRRADCLERVLEEVSASGLPVRVSLDRCSSDGHPDAAGRAAALDVARRYFPEESIWQYGEALGCRKHVQTAITRAFEEAEEVIILEDDTLPSPAFFQFCIKALERYRDDERIGIVCGSRMIPRFLIPGCYTSYYPMIWGWATWRRVWSRYDCTASSYLGIKDLMARLPAGVDLTMARWLDCRLRATREGKLDTWGFQLSWTLIRDGMRGFYPPDNLISNIGMPDHTATNMQGWSHQLFRPRVKELSTEIELEAFGNELEIDRWHSFWMSPLPEEQRLYVGDSSWVVASDKLPKSYSLLVYEKLWFFEQKLNSLRWKISWYSRMLRGGR